LFLSVFIWGFQEGASFALRSALYMA